MKYEESDSPKSCHDFRNRGAFLCPEITELSANKIVSRLQKSRHDLTASGPEISFFSESVISTISCVKYKPLIRFQCRFRLRAPDT